MDILKDKAYRSDRYGRLSRYAQFPYYLNTRDYISRKDTNISVTITPTNNGSYKITEDPTIKETREYKYQPSTTAWLKTRDVPFNEYVVKKGDTYDSIALEHYNNPTYYWIICDFNRIIDPMETPSAGKVLRLPSINNIEFNLL